MAAPKIDPPQSHHCFSFPQAIFSAALLLSNDCVCVCICVCVCVCVCLCVCMRSGDHTSELHTHSLTHALTHCFSLTHTYFSSALLLSNDCVCVCICVCVCVCVCLCVCM